MNSYDIIKRGIENGLDDVSIIDELQQYYPTSKIETNISLIDETRNALELESEPMPSKIELNHFLVKNGREFIDLFSGRRFKAFKDKPYSLCHHGLCKKLNALVLKNAIKKSHIPSVFIAIDKKTIDKKSIKIRYQNDAKKQQVWEFTSYEINECMKGIDEGLNDRQMAIKLCCPRECIQDLIKHIDINQKSNRRQNGNIKNKNKSRVGKRGTNRKRTRKN